MILDELEELTLYLSDDERLELMRIVTHQQKPFRTFISEVNPHYKFHWFSDMMIDALQKVVDGSIQNLMILIHPRVGKSELVSRLLPAYFLSLNPGKWVGMATYAADLSLGMSRNAREYYRSNGGALNQKSRSVKEWETTAGGGMWAAGVGGPITGKGFSLGIIDDPIKNRQEAFSTAVRNRHKDWWKSTFYTRRELRDGRPGIVFTYTPWHEDDLGQWLLENEETAPLEWHILWLPAIMPRVHLEVPESCTLIVDDRKPGEPLWYSTGEYDSLKQSVGPYFWSSMWECSPRSLDGYILKRKYWKFWQFPGQNLSPPTWVDEDGEVHDHEVVTAPFSSFEDIVSVVQSWDMTFKSKEENDFVVGQAWTVVDKRYLLHQIKDRMGFSATKDALREMRRMFPQTEIVFVEDKANGPAIIDDLQDEMEELVAVNPMGGKVARAHAAEPSIRGGKTILPHPQIAPWVEGLMDECAAFPASKYDDQVDALTQAVTNLSVTDDVDIATLRNLTD